MADALVGSLLSELREARSEANVSQAALAVHLGWPQSRYSKFERNVRPATFEDVCLVATMLGLRPRLALYRVDEGIRDRGAQRLIGRFCEILAPVWAVAREAPFPTLGDLRSWDVLIRLEHAYRVGIEAETRLRDIQELVRRIRQRELHGRVDQILIVLSNSAHNRLHADELRAALGSAYETSPHALRAARGNGQALPGSGVILL